MSIEKLKEMLPDYAKDLRLNLSALYTSSLLSKQQKAGCFIVAAIVSRNKMVIEKIVEEFAPQLSDQALTAAKTASAIMSMTNIYYRFTHLIENESYQHLPAKLRMNGMATHGIEKIDFELFCIVASSINSCAACLNAHEPELQKLNVSNEIIQESVKIASVIYAISAIL